MIIYNHMYIYIYIHIFYMYYTNISNIHNGGVFQEMSVFIVSSLFIEGSHQTIGRASTNQPQPTHLPTNPPNSSQKGSITALPTELKVRPFTHIMSVQAWVPLRKLCVGGLFRDFRRLNHLLKKRGVVCVWGTLFWGFQKGNPVKKTEGGGVNPDPSNKHLLGCVPFRVLWGSPGTCLVVSQPKLSFGILESWVSRDNPKHTGMSMVLSHWVISPLYK